MGWFSKSENDKYSKIKFLHNKFYFDDNTKPAKITFKENAYSKLKVNNSVVSGEVIINVDDSISIEYSNNVISEPKAEFEVFIDEKKEEALLQKKTSFGSGYLLKPVTEFILNPKIEIIESKITPSPNEFDEIDSLLRKEGLNGIFNDENIKRICLSESDITLSVITAKQPVHGKPARFELIGTVENGHKLQAEQFFAEYVDETPGKPGYNVFGVEIQPEDLMIFPDIGENVLVEDRGLMSLKPGRLIFTSHSINIIEEKSVNQTINYENGYVEYDGDITIDGDIKEGGQLRCTGNLTIQGGVFDSYVFADGDITIIGNVDSSVIYAGFSKTAAKLIETYSLEYLEIFERVMFESSFSAEDGYDYEEKTKSLELAKSEFLSIEQTINPFLSLVEQFGSNEIKNIYSSFSSIAKGGVKKVLDDKSGTEDIKNEMEKFYNLIIESKEILRDDFGKLEMSSSNSSHLFAYNKIKVNGSGTFQTIMESNISVEISGKSLSSNIIAEQFIELEEFKPGNQNDTKLFVKKSNGYIKVNLLRSDSSLQIGGKKYINLEEEENVLYESKNLPKR